MSNNLFLLISDVLLTFSVRCERFARLRAYPVRITLSRPWSPVALHLFDSVARVSFRDQPLVHFFFSRDYGTFPSRTDLLTAQVYADARSRHYVLTLTH